MNRIALALTCCLLTACSDPTLWTAAADEAPAFEGYAQEGRIVDAVTGEALSFARVCEFGEAVACVHSDVEGRYRLAPLGASAEVILEVARPGYAQTLLPLRITRKNQLPTVELMPVGDWAALADEAGHRADPERGDVRFVLGHFVDAEWVRLPGAELVTEGDAGADVWYRGRKEARTGVLGEAVVWNADPGVFTYQVQYDPQPLLCGARTGWQEGAAGLALPVVAGWLTQVQATCVVLDKALPNG